MKKRTNKTGLSYSKFVLANLADTKFNSITTLKFGSESNNS